ncbi:MAG: SCO6745 family protein [Jatrophihabitans sp.]
MTDTTDADTTGTDASGTAATTGTAATAARLHRALEPLHSMSYFAPETEQALVAVGLRPGRMCYFAGRAAAMGAVGPGVVTATFYNFNPELVARHLPRAWSLASPAAVVQARFEAVDQALHRLLGPQQLASVELAEAATLARAAIEGIEGAGRPLYSGHAELAWPDAAHLQLWHAITLLREHRGDGHLIALVGHDLDGIDAIVSHTATGAGFVEAAAQRLRGWSDEQWAASISRLRERGVLEPDGLALTEAGRQLRSAVEAETDRLAIAPWRQLGADRTERLVALAKPLSRLAVANGAFPPGVFARR